MESKRVFMKTKPYICQAKNIESLTYLKQYDCCEHYDVNDQAKQSPHYALFNDNGDLITVDKSQFDLMFKPPKAPVFKLYDVAYFLDRNHDAPCWKLVLITKPNFLRLPLHSKHVDLMFVLDGTLYGVESDGTITGTNQKLILANQENYEICKSMNSGDVPKPVNLDLVRYLATSTKPQVCFVSQVDDETSIADKNLALIKSISDEVCFISIQNELFLNAVPLNEHGEIKTFSVG